jgi:hypothetical protein
MAYSHLAEVLRERAEECFRRAKLASDPSTGKALEKLGYEMIEAAEGSNHSHRERFAQAAFWPSPHR